MKKDQTHKARANTKLKHGLIAETTTRLKRMSFGKDVVRGGIVVEGLQLELPPLGDPGLESNPVTHQTFYLRKLTYLLQVCSISVCKIWTNGH